MSSNKAEGNATIPFVNRQKHDNLSAIVNKGIVCQMIIKTIVERYVNNLLSIKTLKHPIVLIEFIGDERTGYWGNDLKWK